MIPKPAFADWKNKEREECSSVLYQDPMTRTKPGLMVHSKKPCSARRAMRWCQFWAAAMQVTQTPGRTLASITVNLSVACILTPAEHVNAQRLAQRPSLQQEVGRKLAAQVGDVEDGRQPAVLLTNEAGVFPQAEDCLGPQSGLVGLLHAIAEPHQWEEESIWSSSVCN